MTFVSQLTNYKFTLVSCTNFRVSNFLTLQTNNYQKFNLYQQNTLNTLKTIRVYFGVLHMGPHVREGIKIHYIHINVTV